ncbi:MAG: GNAT family N-acetyltransferase [Chitinophagaceae bacterium]|jgi:putative acetyltransferase|nr:GNAT family N-acetyltransferase [Chitinophagaceae bacterium]
MLQLIQIKEEGVLMDEIRTLFRAYEQELDENLCFQSFEDELKDPLKKYGPPLGVLYIATWNNEAAGCIALMPIANNISTPVKDGTGSLNVAADASTPAEDGTGSLSITCEMKRLYVKPEFRKHKIGKALVDQLLQDAERLGYEKMKLDTLQKLQPAIGLYKKHGFVETTAYYENPLEGVVYMEKRLGLSSLPSLR